MADTNITRIKRYEYGKYEIVSRGENPNDYSKSFLIELGKEMQVQYRQLGKDSTNRRQTNISAERSGRKKIIEYDIGKATVESSGADSNEYTFDELIAKGKDALKGVKSNKIFKKSGKGLAIKDPTKEDMYELEQITVASVGKYINYKGKVLSVAQSANITKINNAYGVDVFSWLDNIGNAYKNNIEYNISAGTYTIYYEGEYMTYDIGEYPILY